MSSWFSLVNMGPYFAYQFYICIPIITNTTIRSLWARTSESVSIVCRGLSAIAAHASRRLQEWRCYNVPDVVMSHVKHRLNIIKRLIKLFLFVVPTHTSCIWSSMVLFFLSIKRAGSMLMTMKYIAIQATTISNLRIVTSIRHLIGNFYHFHLNQVWACENHSSFRNLKSSWEERKLKKICCLDYQGWMEAEFRLHCQVDLLDMQNPKCLGTVFSFPEGFWWLHSPWIPNPLWELKIKGGDALGMTPHID